MDLLFCLQKRRIKLNKIKGRLSIAIVCFILAFTITLQFKSVRTNAIDNTTSSARAEQLQISLTEEQEKSEALYKQIIEYQSQIEEFKDDAEESGGYATVLAKQLEQTSITAGLTAVTGEGVVVTMSDSKLENTTGVDENFFIIHDEDLLRVINELRDAGAEALSLNGERILATSEIRCAGSIVSVNNNRYSAPFIIEAIGNSTEMSNALTMRSGVVDVLAQWGIVVEVETKEEITIEAYDGIIDYKYATPVKE